MSTLTVPLTIDERVARVTENLRRFKRRMLRQRWPDRPVGSRLIVCGYGPSLKDTWSEIAVAQQRGATVMTTSGAHDFLIERGVVPAYHVEFDPREHKSFFTRNSHPLVEYFIASTCHPKLFEQLRERKVTMWHAFTDDELPRQVAAVKRFDRKAGLLWGGSNAGLRSCVVGRHIGFRIFDLHAIDCCYDGDTIWAGLHSGLKHSIVQVRVEGQVFNTSDVMMSATDDFFNQLRAPDFNGCVFTIYGGGLLATRWELFLRDPQKAMTPAWWEPVNFEVRKVA